QLRNKRKAPEYLDDAEVEKLLKIFDKSYYSEHRDYMIIMLLLDTGMRIGECLKITVKDLDIEERTIFSCLKHQRRHFPICFLLDENLQKSSAVAAVQRQILQQQVSIS
ncbi:MAG: site-specific integrase, partial [Oscillospiraceae bacterium]|nr:site-specific integrase [Oscillospiraceae bacterium]